MMRLVEQGKVDLRAPVRTYIPNFRVRDSTVSRDVTVWHLLTHLGGWEGQVGGPDRGTATLENFVATTLPDLMQVAPPGKAWSYNNAGFSIAGRVIEVITGKSINAAMRELVEDAHLRQRVGTFEQALVQDPDAPRVEAVEPPDGLDARIVHLVDILNQMVDVVK